MPAQERVVAISPRSAAAVLGLALALVAAVELVLRARTGLTLIAVAAFFAVALDPAVQFFQRRGLARGPAVAAVGALAAVTAGGVGLVLVPPLVDQIGRFADALPGLVADLTKGRGPLGFLETQYHVVERVRSSVAGGGLLHEATSALSALRGAATSVLGVALIAFLTLFMLLEGPGWRARLISLAPQRRRGTLERVAAGVYRCVAGFVTGNLLASLLAAAVATLVMVLAGVPYALPLGLFVGLVETVPFLGPVVATLAVTAVALTRGAATGITVFALLTAYHVIESHTIRPLLYGRAVRLSPLTVLVSILLCTELGGVLGALVAIPVAGAVAVVMRELVGTAEPPLRGEPA